MLRAFHDGDGIGQNRGSASRYDIVERKIVLFPFEARYPAYSHSVSTASWRPSFLPEKSRVLRHIPWYSSRASSATDNRDRAFRRVPCGRTIIAWKIARNRTGKRADRE